MKHLLLNKKNAMTLTELIIATALIGIVMVGAVSVDYAIRSSRYDVSRKTSVSSQIATTMYSLTSDAMEAIGDVADPGIVFDIEGTYKNICFRTVYRIEDHNDDRWTCYSMAITDHVINRCFDLLAFFAAEDSCTGASPKALMESSVDDFFDVVLDDDDNIDYIEFNLETLDDPGSIYHPIKNPEYKLNSRVSPIGSSRR